MFKNLLVVLEDAPEPVGAYAISLAKRLEARVTIIRPRRDGLRFSDGSVEARLEAARGDAEVRKTQAMVSVQNFAKAAITAGVDVEALFPDGGADPRREQVAAFARAFDFTIVGQSEPGRPPQRDDMVGELLEHSGRPVLVVPAIQRSPAQFGVVGVAWDGSAAAARAFGDAMPILKRANKVEIVSIASSHTPPAVVQTGERLAARLARSSVSAAFHRVPTDDDVANALLSYFADVNADILVAGGYGHSRLREALFGGVTRTLLSSQTLPLFLSR